VENEAVEEAIVDVFLEVLRGDRRFFLMELDFKIAERGFKN
jgi:hypothetical protein